MRVWSGCGEGVVRVWSGPGQGVVRVWSGCGQGCKCVVRVWRGCKCVVRGVVWVWYCPGCKLTPLQVNADMRMLGYSVPEGLVGIVPGV